MKQGLLKLLQEEKEMRLKGSLYHQTQIKLAFNSNRMEGNRLSEDQIRYIFETNIVHVEQKEVANADDVIETGNHFSCFDYMLMHAAEDLSEEMLKEFHRCLKRNTSDERKVWFLVGDYKTRPNMAGDMKTTAPGDVECEIRKLLAAYAQKTIITMEDIVDFHHKFERIHPFSDGNGRVGRMIMFKECLKYDILPFIIGHEQRLVYYSGLKEFDSKKGSLMNICLSAQDQYGLLAEDFFPDLN
ncbi:Fic family protein [Lachnospiraceae bacterium ZAX-1]